MRYAVGLMACIAIAFMTITSPENSQTQANPVPVAPASADSLVVNLIDQRLATLVDSVNNLSVDIVELKQREAAGQSVVTQMVKFQESIAQHESDIAKISGELDSIPVVGGCNCDELEERVKALEEKVAKLTNPVKASPLKSSPVKSSPIVYAPRWNNYDGRSLRQHAIEVHGFNPALSDAELARQHDAYHDQYGGDPPLRLGSQPISSRSRTTVVTRPLVQADNCPGGVCPVRQTTVQSSGGLFGFGILGRRR